MIHKFCVETFSVTIVTSAILENKFQAYSTIIEFTVTYLHLITKLIALSYKWWIIMIISLYIKVWKYPRSAQTLAISMKTLEMSKCHDYIYHLSMWYQ